MIDLFKEANTIFISENRNNPLVDKLRDYMYQENEYWYKGNILDVTRDLKDGFPNIYEKVKKSWGDDVRVLFKVTGH